MAHQQPRRPLGGSAQKAPASNPAAHGASAAQGSSAARGPATGAPPVSLVTVKSQCDVCGKKGGDLFATECSHLTLCADCGRTMAVDQVPCQHCGSAVRKLIKEMPVFLGSNDRQYTIGKFPHGLPGFRTGQGAHKDWTLHKDKRSEQQLLQGQQDKGWRIEDDTGQASYAGMPEAASKHASHCLLIRQPKGQGFEAVPVSQWFSFQKQPKVKSTVASEDAEKAMESREKRLAASTARFTRTKEEPEDGTGRGRKGGGARGGSGYGRRGGGGGGEEEDDDELGGGRRGRMGGDEEIMESVGMGGAQEDWEHEEDRQDDDEAVQADAEDSQLQQMLDDLALEQEGEEEGVDMEEMQRVWREAQVLSQGPGEEEDGNREADREMGLEGQREGGQGQEEGRAEDEVVIKDEDEDEDEDHLAFSPVFMNKSAPAATTAPPATPPGAAAAAGSGAGAAPGAGPGAGAGAGAGGRGQGAAEPAGKKKAEGPPGGASPLQAAKRASAEGRKTPPPAKPRPSAAAAAGAPAAAAGPAKPTELTEAAVSCVLRAGPMTSKDLVTRFKHLLKQDEDKKRFQKILKNVGKMQTQKGQKVIVLKS